METFKRHLLQDFLILLCGIFFAFMFVQYGFVHGVVESLRGFTYVGIFVAGMFFTSIFTTAPAIAFLAEFAHSVPILGLALIGGLGATMGDFVLSIFVRERVSADLDFLLRSPRSKRFRLIFRTKLFRFFSSFFGALIIASPFPDEVGVALLSLSRLKQKFLLPILFFMNSVGIIIIGLIARGIIAS